MTQRGNTKTFALGSGASTTFGTGPGSVALRPRGILRSATIYLLSAGGPLDCAIGLQNGDIRMILESGTIRTDSSGANFADCLPWSGYIELSSESAFLMAIIGENDTNATVTIRLAWDATDS